MVKVFDSVPRPEDAEEYPGTSTVQFALPGDEYVYTAHVPKRSVWQRTQLANRSKNVSDDRKVAALIDYLAGALRLPEDRQRFEDRLLDGTDALDLIDLFPVVTWLSRVWNAQVLRFTGKALSAEQEALLAEVEGNGEPTAQPAPEPAPEPGAQPPAEPTMEPAPAAEPTPVAQPALPPVPPPA